MPAGVHNFTIEQGATWRRELRARDGAQNLLNLSGYSARMQIRKSVDAADVLIELSTANSKIALGGTTGTITLVLTATETRALTKSGDYDLELTAPNGDVTRLLEGKVTLKREVTR